MSNLSALHFLILCTQSTLKGFYLRSRKTAALTNGIIWLLLISVDETELEFSKHKSCQYRVTSKYATILSAAKKNIAGYY